jgi:hypothetical protein
MTVDELHATAEAYRARGYEIDLAGLRLKADIRAAIAKALYGEPTSESTPEA